ncbi:MAG: ABC transporter permease subunit [Clostridia bacterium]|nr:ABC transporter permease subunit [Clostridia bacterium]
MANEKNTKRRTSTFSLTLRRLFLGLRASEMTIADERYDSPSKLAVKRFFRKPLAVGALVVLVLMFLVVFIGPAINPIDLSYTETLHKNVAPNMSMMKLPSSLKENPISISSQGSFTLGLDDNGDLYTWGYYKSFDKKNPIKNVMSIPDEVKKANIVMAAAGTDHCIAIGDDGKIYAWGNYDLAQYGRDGRMLGQYPQPIELIEGTINVENIAQLICGTQMTAILMKDGELYAWGNAASNCMNLDSIYKAINKDNVKLTEICFTTTNLFGITDDGKFITGSNKQYEYYKGQKTQEYIGDRRAVDIASTGDSIAVLLDDGEIISLGTISASPEVPEGEKISAIEAGTRHFVMTTESGKVFSWGNGALGQTDVPSSLTEEGAVDKVIVSGFQNYAYKDGELVEKWGLKGYIMGTDDLGRDVFNRVINGGKMTMTIGAVAVIVSSINGIIVGCISGYFGGWVDLLFMRVTEIFSAIPFLPFALVLSAILQGSSLSEDIRIFIIMIILGLLSWTGLAKLVRGQILAEREKEFVIAAQSMGVKEGRIAFKHILPNVISVIIVSLTLDFASCMLTESSLSYLGFGVKLPRPTWGNMLDGCRDSLVIQNYWWRWVFPALFLAITVICINIIGDTLRDIFDPKSEVEK